MNAQRSDRGGGNNRTNGNNGSRNASSKNTGKSGGSDLRFSPWNFLLLLPLLMLITAWFNQDSPRLFGMPFFYWFQMAFVIVGVTCVSLVYLMTKNISGKNGAAQQKSTDTNARNKKGNR